MGYPPVILDVRPTLAQGQEPFATIMQTVGRLQPGQELLLIAPFEPIPLYEALRRKGFARHTEHPSIDEWRIRFRQAPGATDASDASAEQFGERTVSGQASATQQGAASAADDALHLDTRGMEAPLPLALILSTLETLDAGRGLVALIDREPLLLFPELVERGWVYDGAFQDTGDYRIHIYRPR